MASSLALPNASDVTSDVAFHSALTTWLNDAWFNLFPDVPLTGVLAACPSPTFGDLTHSGAMAAAKVLRKAPIQLAQQLATALPFHPWVSEVKVMAPGHLNITLNDAGIAALLSDVLYTGANYGLPIVAAGEGPRTIVEFVSANPTGPLHIGHARQAAIGDVLARLLASQGALVHREFYYNDAGVQIENLVNSVHARLLEAYHGVTLVFERDHLAHDNATATDDTVEANGATFPSEDVPPPAPSVLFAKNWYHGDYIVDVAHAFHAAHGKAAHGDRALIASFAIQAMRHEQEQDLAAIGVSFDRFFSERSLHDGGAVAATLQRLTPWSYEKDGATWLKTTDFGDDKDRVMVKGDGQVTYFVPDVAYHWDKWERGFARAINVQGSDHHGTQARVKAGLAALGVSDPAFPTYLFHTMVKVIKDGHEVPTSKRSGGYVTLRELVADIGADAVRFLLLQRKADTDTTIDVNLATRASNENPVHYVNYAHARACSLLAQVGHPPIASELEGEDHAEKEGAIPIDWHPSERTLIALIAAWPGKVKMAADKLEPHRLTHDLHELAAAYHAVYHHGPKVRTLPLAQQAPHVALSETFRTVVQQGAGLLGVTLPERMDAIPNDVGGDERGTVALEA